MLMPLILAIHASAGDPDLVRRLQQRDPHALGELYDRYGRPAFSLILRIVRDAGIAGGLVQETFLCAWNRGGAFDAGKDEIGPWLLAIARDRAIDYLRSSGRAADSIELEQTDHLLAAAPDDAAPSPRLRRRIMASIGAEERRFGWAPFLAATTLLFLFAAFYFSSRERQFANETLLLRDQLRRQFIDLTRHNEAFAILGAPGTIEAAFGPEPKGKVFVNPQRGILLIASNLPPAPSGKIYAAWVIPKSGKPIPAGLFQSESTGAATHVHPGPVAADASAIAVSLEPAQGSDQPTSAPLVAANLR
jgi:hypothetical protein